MKDRAFWRSRRFSSGTGPGLLKWALVGAALFGAVYVARAMAMGRISLRLPIAMLLGSAWLAVSWNKGLILILAPVAFAVWVPQRHLNYYMLEPILVHAPTVEIAVYVALLMWAAQRRRSGARDISHLWLLGLLVLFALLARFAGALPGSQIAPLAFRWSVLAPVSVYVVVAGGLSRPKDVERLALAFLSGLTALAVVSSLAAAGRVPAVAGAGLESRQERWLETAGRFEGEYMIPLAGRMRLGGNLTVVFASMAVPLALSLWLSGTTSRIRRIIAAAAMSTNAFIVVIAGSRGAWLGAVCGGIVVIVAFARSRRSLRWIPPVLLLGAGMALGGVYLSSQGYISETISDRFYELVGVARGAIPVREFWLRSTGGRPWIWRAMGPTLLRYPLGVGFIETYATVGGPDVGLHSQFLQLLMGTGVPGTAAFAAFLALCVRRCLRGAAGANAAVRWVAVGAAGVVVAYVFDAFMINTTQLFGADIALFLICGAGVAAVSARRPPEADRDPLAPAVAGG